MPDFPRTAFLLGAGLGTRLRPLTENCPKPLLPIGGRPMVLQAMEKLRAAGTRRFLINTHHRPEAWALAFPDGRFGDAEVKLVHEPVLLETGGGLANIAGLLGEEDADLVVWNGDILSSCDIAAAVAHHRANGGAATLVVREQGPNRNVRITDEGFVTDLRDRVGTTDPAYQYAGICVATKAFVQGVPPATESLVEHFLRCLQAEAGSIQGFLDASPHWHDLGTIEEFERVKAEQERPVRGAITSAEAARAHGYELAAGDEVLKGGSGRRFHRVRKSTGESAVLCVYDDSRPENLLYGDIAGVMRDKIGVQVPQVLAEDKAAGVLVLEDLGDSDLCSLTQGPEFPWTAFASALEQVAGLHRHGVDGFAGSGITLMEAFGPNLYQWERQYFQDNVLGGRRPDRAVADEMASLAKQLMGQPVVTIHRDFQSQNIMVREGSAWLVDLQGLRHGCMFYDYASLAFDPYLTRPDMDLWRIEIEDHAREVSGWNGSSDEFSHLFHVAATQRLLQACGAYAFLGHKKGRPEYLAHLPQGLRNLKIAASLCGRRRLARLAEDLAGAPAKVSR
jgi:aminoglycoside/choline kinase family phosphotransferase/choline kinase